MGDYAEFASMLQAVRPWVTGDTIGLAPLGVLLRRIDRSFSPGRWGFGRLGDLLRQVPSEGTIGTDERGFAHFQFRSEGQEREAPTADSGPERIRDEGGQRTSLALALWKAVTSFHPPSSAWKFDLETLRPVGPHQSEAALFDTEPERFLSLPDAGAEFQMRLFDEFAHDTAKIGDAEIAAVLSQPDWFNSASQLVARSGLEAEWKALRQGRIVRLVTEWADAHGIDRSKLLNVGRRKPRVPDAAPPPSLPSGAESASFAATRQALHRLVDSLPESELQSFTVPARWLPYLDRD